MVSIGSVPNALITITSLCDGQTLYQIPAEKIDYEHKIGDVGKINLSITTMHPDVKLENFGVTTTEESNRINQIYPLVKTEDNSTSTLSHVEETNNKPPKKAGKKTTSCADEDKNVIAPPFPLVQTEDKFTSTLSHFEETNNKPPKISGRKKRMCQAKGCEKGSQGSKKTEEDEYGPPGYRCSRHGGGKRCNVEGCNNMYQGDVIAKDEFGEPGIRCRRHGADIKFLRCNVLGCSVGSEGQLVREADSFGESGYRCTNHLKANPLKSPSPQKTCNKKTQNDQGNRKPCNICDSQSVKLVVSADVHGVPGFRCKEHGDTVVCETHGCSKNGKRKVNGKYVCIKHGAGSMCDIKGCKNRSKGKVEEGANVSEYRCMAHGGRVCQVEGCFARSEGTGLQHGKGAKKYGPRCGKHMENKK